MRGPIRETALLIAEARPELRSGTELMSAVVSGATRRQMPAPNRMLTGRTSTKKSMGGTSDDGFAIAAVQGRDIAGRRTYHEQARAP